MEKIKQNVNESLCWAGSLVKKRRLAMKLTLREAAAHCGLSVGTYHDIERGNWGSGVGNFLMVAFALEVDLGCLFIPEPVGNIETTIVNGRVRRRIIEDIRNPNCKYNGMGELIVGEQSSASSQT